MDEFLQYSTDYIIVLSLDKSIHNLSIEDNPNTTESVTSTTSVPVLINS